MRLQLLFLLTMISAVLIVVNCKTATKTLYKSHLQTKQNSIFLTKFDFGVNGGMIRIKAKRKADNTETELRLLVDVVTDEQLQQYKSQSCTDRKQHILRSQQLFLHPKMVTDVRNIKIQPQSHQQIHYLYYVNCVNQPNIIQNQNQSIEFQIIMYNDESHFGEDEKLLMGYFVLMGVWLVLVFKYAFPMIKTIVHSSDQLKLTVYGALITLGFAYFYRLLHLGIYYANGSGVYFFDVLYLLLKTGCEFVIATVIVAVGWGWSVTHLSHDQSYILAGVAAAIINIVGVVVDAFAQQLVDSHHKYDSTAGNILLLLRFLILIIFLIGTLRTFNNQTGKIRKFIKKFTLVGGIYLAIWPFTTIFSELFLPNYMHNQVITFSQELIHLIGIWVLCQMISHPESVYRKISLKQEDNPLKMQNYKRK